MKKHIYTAIMILFCISLSAQDISPLYRSLEQSNFKELLEHLDDPVEVCINDEQDILDKADAIVTIRSFFTRVKPLSITQIHKGSSANKGSQYRVAKLNTENGKFRLFLYLEKSREGYIIKEFRIDPEQNSKF